MTRAYSTICSDISFVLSNDVETIPVMCEGCVEVSAQKLHTREEQAANQTNLWSVRIFRHPLHECTDCFVVMEKQDLLLCSDRMRAASILETPCFILRKMTQRNQGMAYAKLGLGQL